MLAGVELEVPFAGPFADAIRRNRIGGRVFAGGFVGIAVEYAAGGSKHDPLRPRAYRSVQNVNQTQHVHLGIESRLPDGSAHRHLGGLMANGFGLELCEHLCHRRPVADIDLVERNIRGDVLPAAGRQIIQHPRLMAVRQKLIHNVAADEPRSARH